MSNDNDNLNQDNEEFIEQLLVDELFGELDESQAALLKAKLAEDSNLAARKEDIKNTFDALSLAEETDIPEGLADRTLAWIDSVRQTNTLINMEQLGSGYRPTFALKELFAIAALLIIAVSVVFSSLHVAKVKGRENLCMSQMGEIGSALNNYAMDNDSILPTALAEANPNWLSHGAANQPANSSALFRLLRQQYLSNPTIFQCPSVGGKSFAMNDEMKDFPDNGHINYSYQHSLRDSRVNTALANRQLAILSDENPCFTGGKCDTSHKFSRNHKYGQAVLYVDGRCKFHKNSNVGIGSDNIFIPAGSADKYTGDEMPASKNDSFLLPN